MSTFAVWGMNEVFAVREAQKRVGTVDKNGDPLSPKEWMEGVAEYAEKLMDGKRSVRLSPIYDSPQWCKEFIAALKKNDIQCRDLEIKAQVKEKASPTAKSKKPYKLAWIPESQFKTHQPYAG